jgi:choline-sulfatase
MRQAGYRTYMTGKWHCRASAAESFDVVADVRGGMPNQTAAGYNRPIVGEEDPWSPSDPKFGGFWKGGTHWSEVVANHTVDFLQDAEQRDDPFFMYVAFNAPHDPRQSPRQFVDRYPAEQLRIPASYQPLYPYKDAIGCGPGLRDEKLAPFPRTEHAVRVHRQEYYAIISHMDQQIGRILEALEQTGQAENTWIFFTADHGLAVGNHGLMGKQNLYDHSVRVPFVAVGPAADANRTIETPIYLQDVMATSLELAGIERPAHVEFQSVLPLLAGESRPERPIYGAYLQLQRSIRTDRYKLIAYPRVPKLRLYDLREDPQETRDLADNPEYHETVERLFEELVELQADMDDPLDLRQAFADF